MMRRVGGRAAVAVAFGLIMAGTMPAQQAARGPATRSDSLVFIVEDRIDGLGTKAILTRPDGELMPIIVDLEKASISPPLINEILRVAERYNAQPDTGTQKLRVMIPKKATLRPVAAKDKKRIDAIIARLRRPQQRPVPGAGMQRAVAVPLK
jgi:hypothetical protein